MTVTGFDFILKYQNNSWTQLIYLLSSFWLLGYSQGTLSTTNTEEEQIHSVVTRRFKKFPLFTDVLENVSAKCFFKIFEPGFVF